MGLLMEVVLGLLKISPNRFLEGSDPGPSATNLARISITTEAKEYREERNPGQKNIREFSPVRDTLRRNSAECRLLSL